MTMYPTRNITTMASNSTIPKSISSCQLPFSTQLFVCAIILALTILLANITVVYLFLKTHSLRRSPANTVLVSFAFNDILSGLTIILHSIPFIILTVENCSLRSLQAVQHISNASYFLSRLTILCCVGHLIMLSTDRLIALFYALRYDELLTKCRNIVSISIIWAIAVVVTIIDIGASYGMKDRTLYNKMSVSITVLFFLIVPCVVLSIQYTVMLSLVHKLMKSCPIPSSKQKTRTNRKALILYGLMFLSFVLLCLPFFLIRILLVYGRITYTQIPTAVGEVIFLMRYVTSVLNPVLYAFFKHDYRQALLRSLKPYCNRLQRLSRTISQDTTETYMLDSQTEKC